MRTKDKLSHFTCRIRSYYFVFSLFMLAGTYQATAQRVDQLTDDQVLEFYRKAQASGLSEPQIEQAAMSQGFTLTDIAKMRKRIAELQSKGGRSTGQSYSDTSNGRRLPTDLSRRFADTSLYMTRKDTSRRLKVFGASLFENANLSFEPNLRIATPRNYIVGPDDEIGIDISGAASDNFRLKVTPEGTVKVPNIQPIFVAGLTIEQAEQRIVARLRKAGYQGLGVPGSGTDANVALTNIRSINVTLVGEVVRPGTYTVSSLGSAFNALYLAGGPNPETGSFRKISVIRGNRVVRTIDLYDFILRADQRDNIRLQDQDVIRVADYDTRIELAGEVRRPAIFEVLPGETLKTVLGFAGGFSDDAYRASITLRRNTAKERRIVTISEDQLATFVPQRGDKYLVGKILERYENRVQVAGAVMRPGDYALEPGLETVKQLINRADGLQKDAFTNRATIIRERADMDTENISFDLGKLMRGETPDIPLMRQDSLTVLSIRDLREEYYVIIEGAVNKPDTVEFVNNMSVADLIAVAGGFQEGAKPNLVEVARRIRQDSVGVRTTRLEIFRFSIDRNLQISPLEGNPATGVGGSSAFRLQPFDIVYVRTSANYEVQRQVYVSGEVMQPGNYAIYNRQERIADVIIRAGGLKPEAYMAGAQYRRLGQVVGSDLRNILNDPGAEENLLLNDGDTLIIPRRSEIVAVQGAVLNPSSVSYKAGYKFGDYVDEAGGFTDNARSGKAYIIYPNGRKDRTHKFLFFASRPRVEPGSIVVVPFKPLDNNKLTAAERIGIFSLLATVSIALINVLVR
ncbi:SLBB domain-containing protein [Spirosoma soli]|uniref:SLBB domain-containing protein n=1 Tax=Spirosoma soli TaxID=1770529 RepID=A0ABW5M3K8_9BACT